MFFVQTSAAQQSTFSGQVRLSGGLPVGGAQVMLFDLTDLQRGPVAQATTDEDGQFALVASGGSGLPQRFALGQNYPNPFNPSTIIPYHLPMATPVRLEIFNLLGQRVATLVDGTRLAGFHTVLWDATDAVGQAVGAGVYIYRLSGGGETWSRKMVLVDGQAGSAVGGGWLAERPTETDPPVYGLTVSGEGLVPYVDPAFQVEAGRTSVEVVLAAPVRAKRLPGEDRLLGDVDGKGRVDIVDALLVAASVGPTGLTTGGDLDGVADGARLDFIDLGDVNGDGVVNLIDAYLIGVYSVNPSDPMLPAGIGKRVSSASDGPPNKMYWTDPDTDKIQRANLDGSNVEDLITQGLDVPDGIALDVERGKIYWTHWGSESKIQRANLDGSDVEDLITQGLVIPGSIALDVERGKIYWTATATGKIQRANLDGSNVEDLITSGVSSPYGIALDVERGKIYWTATATGKIQRANLDGSNVEDLITSGVSSPYGIALDVERGKIYWTDSEWTDAGGPQKIQRANLDGSNVEDLITRNVEDPSTSELVIPTNIALDVERGKMYWTDWFTGKIQRANLDGSNVEDLITHGLDRPTGIALGALADSDVSGGRSRPDPDLVVEKPSVSDEHPWTGQSFTLRATVRNRGNARSSQTTLRYYRSDDSTISTNDRQVGRDNVSGLSASATSAESIDLTAPSGAGTYYYGACVESINDESDTSNNCSTGVRVSVQSGSPPDLVVESPSVSDNTLTPRQSFTLRATVRNRGNARSSQTTLRYYRSDDSTISTNDRQVGRDNVSGLSASATSAESIDLTAPSGAGTYYYGACVGSVINESDTSNNCSTGVRVTVSSDDGGNDDRSSGGGGGGNDDYSNTRSGATNLSLGDSRSGRIETGGDVDYFKVEVSSSGTLTVYTTGDTDTYGSLQNSSGSEQTNNDDGGDGNNFNIERTVTPGTYYVRVQGYDSSTTGSYTVHARFQSSGGGSTRPDLVVESPSVSDNTLTTEQSFTLRATVRNRGDGRSAATTLHYYYRSDDSTISRPVGRDNVSGLSASATSAESIDLTAPSGAGTYYYGACVESVPDESDTSNNCSTGVRVTVSSDGGGNDDRSSGGGGNDDHSNTRSGAINLSLGDSRSGRIETGGDVDYFKVEVSSSGTLTVYTTGDTDTYGSLQNSSGSDLASDDDGGSDNNFRIEHTVTPGTYYIRVRGYGSSTTGSYTVHARFQSSGGGSARPDLVVESPSVSDNTLTTEQSFTLRATVRNRGDGRSAATTLHYYYRSDDSTISRLVGRDNVSGLSASATSAESIDLTAPPGAGTYYYGACVESVNDESDTSNNCSTGVRVTVSSDGGGNDDHSSGGGGNDDYSNTRSGAINLSLGDSRSGRIETGGDVDYFKVEVSSSGTLTVYTTGDTDTYGSLQNSSGSDLASDDDGGSDNNFRIEHTVTPGTYYIRVRGYGSSTTGSYTVIVDARTRPDLVVKSPSVSDNTLTTGQSFTLSATVFNRGLGQSAATVLFYYRSDDSTISTNDRQVGTDNVYGLSGGEEDWGSINLTAPSGAGTYYYGACVESVNDERDTSNNCSIGVLVTVSHDDHSNTRSGATNLSLGGSLSGRIDIGGDVDYFKMEVSRSGTLTVYTTGDTDTYGTLQNSSGSDLERNNFQGGNDNFNISRSVSAGTYYIRVKGGGSSTTGNYTVHARFGDIDDHSDTRLGATDLSLGGSRSGRIETGGDVDYFRVQVSSSGTLTVYTTGDADTYGTLQSSLLGRNLVSSDDGGSDNNFRIEHTVTPGTYYIRVQGHNSSTIGSYTVHTYLREEREEVVWDDHSDTREGATDLPSGGSLPGRIEPDGDVDYFKVEVSIVARLTVYTTGDTDTYGTLQNSSGSDLESDDDGGDGKNFRIESLRGDGTYYVKVEGDDNSTGDYTIHVRADWPSP